MTDHDHSPLTACRVCGNTTLEPILDLGLQAFTGIFPRSPDAVLPRGRLQLVKCVGTNCCGLVQLGNEFDPTELYGTHYGYRSGLNPSMVAHLRSKVAAILAQSPSPESGDRVVLDIGANDGTTLSFYPQQGHTLIGMDPSAEKFRGYYPDHVQLVTDFFSAKAFLAASGGRRADIVTSIAMFYDLPSPQDFVNQIREILAPGGSWTSEQSYLPLMLERNAYDTVCHEHLEYYALRQIDWLVDHAGLKLVDAELNDINGGSFSFTAVHRDDQRRPSARLGALRRDEAKLGLDGLEAYRQFAARVAESRRALLGFLSRARAMGESVAGLGASTKGNVLLQYCGIGPDDLPLIGEVNPDKYGCYTPGTAIPIVPQGDVLATEPDYLLVLPWHFRDFLVKRGEWGRSRLVFPLPKLEIV
ncbi:class I SAM-dependent methyltransferase [Aromatoleum toluolicum]|uniref:Methyltransferase domain-containing protein n=1 Tax=Aromatoleum toluolicum TaxID=90060 RepID=A0ABX1NKV0_9RHOO|nr:class I SAM-dependent methyltransferase [Aromatoleum toluolicum]NMF99884.1 class I SAM-dependent methyltransferase [Aromatoleum toluolicum]